MYRGTTEMHSKFQWKSKLFFLYQKKTEISKHSGHSFCYLAFLPVHWSIFTVLYICLNLGIPNINNTKSWSRRKTIRQGPRIIWIPGWSPHPLHSSIQEGCIILGWSGAIVPSSPNSFVLNFRVKTEERYKYGLIWQFYIMVLHILLPPIPLGSLCLVIGLTMKSLRSPLRETF